MNCERCFSREEALYRVYTDAMDMKVCLSCAEEAREVGIKVELLDGAIPKENAPSAMETCNLFLRKPLKIF